MILFFSGVNLPKYFWGDCYRIGEVIINFLENVTFLLNFHVIYAFSKIIEEVATSVPPTLTFIKYLCKI